jgi:alpha-N-acetylglucosaminidase
MYSTTTLLSTLLLLLGAGVVVVSNAHIHAYDSPTSAAATAVLIRTIPDYVHKFELKYDPTLASSSSITTLPSKAGKKEGDPVLPNAEDDHYHIQAVNGKVTVTANSGVALTHGAYQYIKQQLKGQVTWGVERTGMQLNLSSVAWPDFDSGIVKSNAPVRYAWNTCTFSYTAAFWDEARWLKEIDWMALHGVNFPLAATGQEYVYMVMFQRYYNISLTELQDWFAGPAFLTWQRFGNIQKFAGPLPNEWIVAQKDLNLYILKNMRALGMKPVLSCFPGHVPTAFQKKYPNAKISPSSPWNGFPSDMTSVPFLDPSDPLFLALGSQFLTVQQEIFGTDNYYACDTFNEVDPTNASEEYLKLSSKVVADAIAAVDPKGVWMIQAWTFKFSFWTYSRTQAYLSGVPIGKLIILDLESMIEILAPNFNYYFGHFWVFNLLHNFGGNRAVYGPLTTMSTTTAGPYAYLPSANAGGTNGNRMAGIGFTPEAIEQNPAVYEMLTDTFFRPTFDGSQWINDYITQRYQLDNPSLAGGAAVKAVVVKAWAQMRDSVYNSPAEPRTELEWTPFWWKDQYGWQNGNPDGFYQAFLTLLQAAEMSEAASGPGKFTLLSQAPFQYDFVDVSRQGTTMFWSDAHRMWGSEVQLSQNFAGVGSRSLRERSFKTAE